MSGAARSKVGSVGCNPPWGWKCRVQPALESGATRPGGLNLLGQGSSSKGPGARGLLGEGSALCGLSNSEELRGMRKCEEELSGKQTERGRCVGNIEGRGQCVWPLCGGWGAGSRNTQVVHVRGSGRGKEERDKLSRRQDQLHQYDPLVASTGPELGALECWFRVGSLQTTIHMKYRLI
ncbi:hypothetical protein BDZ91DRAFT_762672 [Kalaharituber pfeilii]|nr:hypothetical protein BDZ91DRAFT_762672 [Kalaharituber pfeilii]